MTTDHTSSEKPIVQAPQFIERSMLAIQRRTRRLVSPWVQRAMNTDGKTGTAGERSVSLSARQTQHLLKRIQRNTDQTPSWHPDLGSLQPAMVSRFADSISDRYQLWTNKHQPVSNVQRQSANDRIELPLADGMVRSEASVPDMSTQTFESSGSGFPSFGPSATGTTRAIPEPSATQVLRKPSESSTVTPAVQDVRAALQRNLSAHRGIAVPKPTFVNPPHPSVNQVRRVARIEEIDPVSIAAQNETSNPRMSDEIVPNATELLLPRPTIARSIQRNEVDGASEDTLTRSAPAEPEPASDVGMPPLSQNELRDASLIRPPSAANPPKLQRRVSNQNIHREIQPDTSEGIRDSKSTGDLSPLQRMRQARSTQVQRTPGVPASVDQQQADSIEKSTIEPASPSPVVQASTEPKPEQALRPGIQRHISELPNPETHIEAGASQMQVTQVTDETPDDQLPPKAVNDSAVIQRKVTEETLPADDTAVIPPLIAQRPEEKERRHNDDTVTVTRAPVEMKSVDNPDASGEVVDQVQRKPIETIVPGSVETLTSASHQVVTQNAQAVTQRSPALESSDRIPSDTAASETQRPDVDTSGMVDTDRTLPISIQRKPVRLSSHFQDHVAARIETNLRMPLTQHVRSGKQAVQRSINLPEKSDNEPQPTQNVIDARQVPSVLPRVARVQRTAVESNTDSAPQVSEQPSVGDVGAQPVSIVSDRKKPVVQGLETETPEQRTETRRLPLRPTRAQRSKELISGPDTDSTLPAILPQVREAAGAETEPGIGEHQRVSVMEFTVQRSMAPAITRTSESKTMRMPLLQRKAAVHETLKKAAPEPAIEIKRLVEPDSKPDLVMRKPKQSIKISKDVNPSVRRVNSESYESEPGETRVIRPDIGELATAIVPLIRRMLAVERERARGL